MLASWILTLTLLDIIKRPSGAYSLRRDVNFVTNKLIELAGSGNPGASERWKAQQREDIEGRKIVSPL